MLSVEIDIGYYILLEKEYGYFIGWLELSVYILKIYVFILNMLIFKVFILVYLIINYLKLLRKSGYFF